MIGTWGIILVVFELCEKCSWNAIVELSRSCLSASWLNQTLEGLTRQDGVNYRDTQGDRDTQQLTMVGVSTNTY
jgi:hypothetical protein